MSEFGSIALVVFALAAGMGGQALLINGAGATFPYPSTQSGSTNITRRWRS